MKLFAWLLQFDWSELLPLLAMLLLALVGWLLEQLAALVGWLLEQLADWFWQPPGQEQAAGLWALLSPALWLPVVMLGWLAFLGQQLQASQESLLVTSGLLVAGVFVAAWTLWKRKRVPVLLSLTSLAVFSLLHDQISQVLGPDHYRWQCPPSWLSWIQFSAVQTLRAIDVLDILEECDLHLQSIKHNSTLAGLVLLAFHATMGFFVLALLVRLLRWAWGWLRCSLLPLPSDVVAHKRAAERLGWWLTFARWLSLLACTGVFTATVWVRQWPSKDWWLWPLDNLLRLLDFADAMQIFGWQLHEVPKDWWTRMLAIWFRLTVAVFVMGWINRLHLLWLREWSLQTIEDYVGHLNDSSTSAREAAAEILGLMGPAARSAVPRLIEMLADRDWELRRKSEEALQRIDPAWASNPSARSAVPHLVERLADKEKSVQEAAVKALGQLGPAAQSAIPWLIERLANNEEAVRKAAAEALGQMGPAAQAAIPRLIEMRADWFLRWKAEEALQRIDPAWTSNSAVESVSPRLSERLEQTHSDDFDDHDEYHLDDLDDDFDDSDDDSDDDDFDDLDDDPDDDSDDDDSDADSFSDFDDSDDDDESDDDESDDDDFDDFGEDEDEEDE